MGRQRDPNRDKAFDIFKAYKGQINLIDIATQLEVSDGTVRGWKAKDKWENLLTGEAVEVERSNKTKRNAPIPEQIDEDDGEQDELFLNAVLIVVEAQQASVTMLQRRLRVGYTRSARLIDAMEKRGYVGPYRGEKPREVLIKEFNPGKEQRIKPKRTERNAPKKETERSNNTERSKKVENAAIQDSEPEPEEEENDGFTQRQRLFVKYYLVNFNATQAAIKSGYSPKAAKEIGYRLLTYAHIKEAIKKYNEEISFEIGMNVQRTIMEYMKIAFSDITEFVEFGQKEEPLFTDDGPAIDPKTGEQMTYKRNFVMFKDSGEVDGALISEVKQGKDGVGIKLHDKMKALEVLTKYHDLLPDHHKRMVDNEKLKLDRERLELDKQTMYWFVSVRSGQGVGKTALEAAIALWFLCCFPFPRVVCTAPTRQQLNDVLWAEISKWQSKSPILKRIHKWTKTKIYMRKYEERWFATARTATKPEKMQGFHEDHMLFIVDEASGVEDRIMEAILGTLSGEYNKLLMCGNPSKTSEVFFDSHNKDRADYKTHKVSCLDSPRTSKENIEMLKRKYGEGSDVWRVRVLGEFPSGESDAFISLEMASFAKDEVKVIPEGDILYIGADIARFGDDETAIYARLNGAVIDSQFHHKEGLMVTAGWILNMAARCKKARPDISQVQIRIDDDGLGGGVTDRVNEVNEEQGLGYEIIPVHNGGSTDDEHYGNKGSELWGQVKERLDENMSNYILGLPGDLQLPDDDKLITQLTTRKWRMGSNGRIYLEPKKDMKKRGLPSPDR